MQQLAQDGVVLQAASLAAGIMVVLGVWSVVPRALGKWRGSTLPGYLTHDDITFRTNFR